MDSLLIQFLDINAYKVIMWTSIQYIITYFWFAYILAYTCFKFCSSIQWENISPLSPYMTFYYRDDKSNSVAKIYFFFCLLFFFRTLAIVKFNPVKINSKKNCHWPDILWFHLSQMTQRQNTNTYLCAAKQTMTNKSPKFKLCRM